MLENSCVLIVDDSRVSRMMIKALIVDKRPSWTILEAESGDAALSVCAEHHVDGLSIDLNMPGMHGLDLAKQIQEKYSHARMAVLTANIQEATHRRASELGIVCINKPISEEAIDKVIEAIES
ncbi:MAG: response regulator [Pseudomonadota bacterium]